MITSNSKKNLNLSFLIFDIYKFLIKAYKKIISILFFILLINLFLYLKINNALRNIRHHNKNYFEFVFSSIAIFCY